MTAASRTGGMADGSRREFLASAALALLSALPTFRPSAQDSLPGSGPSGKLWDPSRAGRPLDPVTAGDNDAAIQAIEKRLKCQCGTCNLDVYTCRTTDFTCGTSPVMHRRVVAMVEAGTSAQEVVDAFVRDYGVTVLMAPPKRGFNLAGYFVPSLAIGVAAVALLLVLRRWTRGSTPAVPVAAPDPARSPAELERLRRELDKFPG